MFVSTICYDFMSTIILVMINIRYFKKSKYRVMIANSKEDCINWVDHQKRKCGL